MAPRIGTENHGHRAPGHDGYQPFVHPQNGCVLVVDDDPDVRDMMDAVLTNAGYAVETAENGYEALALLRSIRPAMIFLDVNMPMMDGPEFRAAQRRDPDLLSIPTVVMTAGAVDPMLDSDVEQTLRKPARKAELLAIVQRHCQRGDD